MKNRIDGYLRAIETDETEKYHDYQDVGQGKMKVSEYTKKWGKYTGFRGAWKHD